MVKIHNMTKQHLQRLKVRVLRSIGLPVVFFLSAKVLDARDSVIRPRSLNMFKRAKKKKSSFTDLIGHNFVLESGGNPSSSEELSRGCVSDSKTDPRFGAKRRRD